MGSICLMWVHTSVWVRVGPCLCGSYGSICLMCLPMWVHVGPYVSICLHMGPIGLMGLMVLGVGRVAVAGGRQVAVAEGHSHVRRSIHRAEIYVQFHH